MKKMLCDKFLESELSKEINCLWFCLVRKTRKPLNLSTLNFLGHVKYFHMSSYAQIHTRGLNGTR